MKIEDRGGHLYNRGLLKLCASSLFIFAGTAAGWGAGDEEVSKSAHIGFIVTNEAYPRRLFDQAMAQLGWVEGGNLSVERRITGSEATQDRRHRAGRGKS